MPGEWRDLCRQVGGSHTATWLRQDPFTARAWCKPRRYAGDADSIDLIYDHPDMPDRIEVAGAVGRRLHELVLQFPGCQAVKWRRDFFTATLDVIPSKHIRAFSLACGYLRELERSHAFRGSLGAGCRPGS